MRRFITGDGDETMNDELKSEDDGRSRGGRDGWEDEFGWCRGQVAGVGKAAAEFRSPGPSAGGCGGVTGRGNAQRVSGFAWRGVL